MITAACVNQGLDEDPNAATDDELQSEPATEATPEQEPDTDEDDGPTVDAGDLPVGAVADPAGLATIEPSGCGFDEPVPLPQEPTCHLVTVPEDGSDPSSGNTVVLEVAVFAADDGAEANDATIYLDGGPGGATLDLLWTSFELLHEPQTGPRDYIAFDQRGVGLSEPLLDCPELTELELARLAGELAPGTESEATIDAVGACRDRLVAAGVDLTAYNSVASANDLEAIRQLLGYEQFNLVGVSYGTRLAQTFMRQYPDSVRSAVLDSIVPVESDLWTNLAPEAQGAFEQLFAGCAADAACAEANPDLENRFFALLDRLDAESIEVELRDLLAGDEVTAIVDGDDVLGMVFQALYDQSLFSVIPAMVGEVENGDYRAIEYLGSIRLTNLPYSADAMQISVECNEEIAFESAEELAAVAPTDPGYVRLGELDGEATLFDICAVWPAGSAPEVESEPVVSDLPTLLLAGGYDPITRPGNADIVARSLSNHYSFLLPDEGHGLVSTPCGAELVTAFLADPTVEPDSSCIATSPAPSWTPEDDDGEIELVEFSIDTPFQVTGLRPDGWEEAGPGAFARQRSAIDPTTLIVQPAGGLVPEFVAELLGSQLGIELLPDGTIDAGGREWETFLADDGSGEVVRLAAVGGSDGALVVLVADADDVERLSAEVFLPAVEAVQTG